MTSTTAHEEIWTCTSVEDWEESRGLRTNGGVDEIRHTNVTFLMNSVVFNYYSNGEGTLSLCVVVFVLTCLGKINVYCVTYACRLYL